MKKLIVICALFLVGCTPNETAAWLQWFSQDPEPAMQFIDELAAPSVWDELAECESGGDWHIATGNGFYGGLQFTLSSWKGTGGVGYPHQHSREAQIYRARILLEMQGWNAWPGCARKLGLG